MDRFFSKLGGAAMAALIAVLSGLGVGSGGLLVIWLTMFEGIDAETARGLNLLFFVFSASAAFAVHLIKGRVKLRFVLFLAACACVGTILGTYIGTRIDSLMLKRIFGVMLVISGVYTLSGTLSNIFKKKKNKKIPANR
ncbi:MAG: TSUP family transporter [Eubacteriales bacterium]